MPSSTAFAFSTRACRQTSMSVSSNEDFIALRGLYAQSRRLSREAQERPLVGKGEENMVSLEIRFVMQGKEVSADSFFEAVMQQGHSAVREESAGL